MLTAPVTSSVKGRDKSCAAPHEMGYLNFLRFVAMRCRVMPRANLFEACATLHVDRSKSCQAYAEALMRCVREALGKPVKLHAPGTAEMSFDELWLTQLGKACAKQDHSSMSFLLRSRVAQENQRLVAFLVSHIAEHFDLD